MRFRLGSVVVCLALVAGACTGHDDTSADPADDVTYAYDPAGRLAAVSDPDGQTAVIAYDVAGNRESITWVDTSDWSPDDLPQPVQLPTPDVTSIPEQATPGRAVTISGTGFAEDPLHNVVTVSGVQARVESASETELQVVLPPTESGAVTVATPGGESVSDGELRVSDPAEGADPGDEDNETPDDTTQNPLPEGDDSDPDQNAPQAAEPQTTLLEGVESYPVSLASGQLQMSEADLSVGQGLPVSMTRTYEPPQDALIDTSQIIGPGWGLGYDLSVQTSPGKQFIDLALPSGQEIPFERITGGADTETAAFAVDPSAPTNTLSGSRINRAADGWELHTPDGTVLSFGDEGTPSPLRRVTDAQGNRLDIIRDIEQSHDYVKNIGWVISGSGAWLQFAYDDEDRVTQVTDHLGDRATYHYRNDRLVRVAVRPYDGQPASVVRYEYDDEDRVVAVREDGHTLLLGYDDYGRVRSQQLDGDRWSFDYDKVEEQVRVGDTKQKITRERVRRVTVTGPDGTTRTVRFTDGRWTEDSTTFAGVTSTTTAKRDPESGAIRQLRSADGSVTRFRHDDQLRVTEETQTLPGDEPQTITYTYDGSSSRLATATSDQGTDTWTYDESGAVTEVVSSDGSTWTYDNDGRGRPIEVTGPVGTSTIAYDGDHRVTVTDEDGAQTSQFFDAAGRVTALTEPTGGTSVASHDAHDQVTSLTDPLGARTEFDYDRTGALTSVTDAGKGVTRFDYDRQGRLVERTDPLGAKDHYRYDSAGNLVSHTDRRGVRTDQVFDALGRLIRTDFGAGGTGAAKRGPESSISYSYDKRGRLVRVRDTAYGSVQLHYDKAGRLVSEESPDGQLRFGYDAAGRRSSAVFPGQVRTDYTYDDRGRLASLTQGQAEVSSSWDDSGRLSELALPGDVNASYAYDDRGQVSELAYAGPEDTLGSLRYDYDAAGRLNNSQGELGKAGLPAEFGKAQYDAAHRMVREGDRELVYDKAGNLLDDGDHTYTWDARGQLVAVSGEHKEKFGYDPFGRRVATTSAGVRTTSIWDGDNLAQQRTDGIVTSYLSGPGLDEVFATTTGDTTTTMLPDLQGSIVGTVDGHGNLRTHAYTPFGAPTDTGETTNPGDAADPTGLGFLGREHDTTGLYQLRARYYDPDTGRFLSEDPLGFAGGNTDLYTYAHAAPTIYTDPTGQAAECVGLALGWSWSVLGEGGVWDQSEKLQQQLQTGQITSEQYAIKMDHVLRPMDEGLMFVALACGSELALGGTALAARPLTRTTSRLRTGLNNLTKRITANLKRTRPLSQRQLRTTPTGTVSTNAAKSGTEIRKVGDVLETVDDVMANPQLLKGRHPALVENILKDTPGWQVETLGRGSAQGRGWVFRQYTDAGNPTGLQLRWHPGGGHHGPDPYWRVIGPNGDLGGIIR